jgi:ATP-dependent RNA helicase DDX51/DBP6
MIVLEPSLKPLVLIHLIHHKEYQVKSALVFTKSVESANRLVQLLDAFEEINNTGVVVKSYTSEMKPGERKKLLADFTKGDIHLYVSLCLGEQH